VDYPFNTVFEVACGSLGLAHERVFAIQYSRVCEEMHTHTHTQITSMEDYSFNFD